MPLHFTVKMNYKCSMCYILIIYSSNYSYFLEYLDYIYYISTTKCNNNKYMKSKRVRFEDIASKRVQYIIDKLELLGNCSNRNNYEYEEDDVKKMFVTIRENLRKAEVKFNNELTKQSKNKFKF